MDLLKHIPKGKREAVKDAYRDQDGYWVTLNEGYKLIGYYSERTIHEDTITELRQALRLIQKED